MSHGTICYLYSTIAQTLAAALGIAGGFVAVLLQRNHSLGESHLEVLRELPWDDATAGTKWGVRLVRGDLFSFQQELDALCRRRSVPEHLRHLALQAAAGLSSLGYAQERYVPVFKSAVGYGVPAIVASLITLAAADFLQYQQLAVLVITVASIGATAWCLALLSRLVKWATSGVDVAGYAEWLRAAQVSRAGARDQHEQEQEDAEHHEASVARDLRARRQMQRR
jgi:hypothetical protein